MPRKETGRSLSADSILIEPCDSRMEHLNYSRMTNDTAHARTIPEDSQRTRIPTHFASRVSHEREKSSRWPESRDLSITPISRRDQYLGYCGCSPRASEGRREGKEAKKGRRRRRRGKYVLCAGGRREGGGERAGGRGEGGPASWARLRTVRHKNVGAASRV